MASLLSIDEVLYECGCGEWASLNRLYFCRHCSCLRCASCACIEMDSMFCPMCLDSVSAGEARLKKNRCPNCYQCPCCGMGLSMKLTNGLYNFICVTCRWSSSLSALPDGNWPENCKEDEKKIGSFLENMQSLATAEKTVRERHKYTKRRSNIGTVFSDRFGLQSIYNRRKAALFGSANDSKMEPVVEPTDDIPNLDQEIFFPGNDISFIPTIEQQIRQPLLLCDTLQPVKTCLVGRKGVRCKQCEHSLCKNEYNPNSVKFKIQVIGNHYVPEIRLSRPVNLVIGEWCIVYLTVMNFSGSTVQLTIKPDDFFEENFVKCENFEIDLSVPNRDETAEMDESVQTIVNPKHFYVFHVLHFFHIAIYVNEFVTYQVYSGAVFRRRHQVDFCVKVFSESDSAKLLGITVSYTALNSMPEPKTENVALRNRIRVKLGSINIPKN